MDPPSSSCSSSSSSNITRHPAAVTREDRANLNGHRSAVLWFTGLSGSGKSTIANAVGQLLHQRQVQSYVLDGDNIRHGLCQDLGFSDQDREENIRRIGEVAKLFVDAGFVVLTAFVSPFYADRERARRLIGQSSFIEIYCAADLAVCEERDSKGLYRKARSGQIHHFTGISSPYQEPDRPEVIVQSGSETVESCALQVIGYLEDKGFIRHKHDTI